MENSTFLSNPHFVEYVRLLMDLHASAASGESDDETILDEMDYHWYRLNADEMARVRVISADLQMIESKETFRPASAEERSL